MGVVEGALLGRAEGVVGVDVVDVGTFDREPINNALGTCEGCPENPLVGDDSRVAVGESVEAISGDLDGDTVRGLGVVNTEGVPVGEPSLCEKVGATVKWVVGIIVLRYVAGVVKDVVVRMSDDGEGALGGIAVGDLVRNSEGKMVVRIFGFALGARGVGSAAGLDEAPIIAVVGTTD